MISLNRNTTRRESNCYWATWPSSRPCTLQPRSAERAEKLEAALTDLREAQRLDRHHGELSRRTMYWIGKCYEAQGDPFAAVEQYDRIRKLHGDTAEGLAATLAEADLDRDAGRTEEAFAGYRTVSGNRGGSGHLLQSLVATEDVAKASAGIVPGLCQPVKSLITP